VLQALVPVLRADRRITSIKVLSSPFLSYPFISCPSHLILPWLHHILHTPIPTRPPHPRVPADSKRPGLDAGEKRFGGGKVNPEQSRAMNEKVTDGARGMFEKATGFVLLLFFSIFFPFLSEWGVGR